MKGRKFPDFEKVRFWELEVGDCFYAPVNGSERELYEKKTSSMGDQPGSRIVGLFERVFQKDDLVEYVWDPEIKC